MAPPRPFQNVLGRTQQVKILDFLANRKEPSNVVEIQKRIKVHYIYATKLVNTLEAVGVIAGRREGREHLVWLDRKNPMVKAVLDFEQKSRKRRRY